MIYVLFMDQYFKKLDQMGNNLAQEAIFVCCLPLAYPGSEVPKSVRVQAKTAVRRTSERSERRGRTSGHPGP